MRTQNQLWHGSRVKADSVEDFAARFRKHDRYQGRGLEYADAILESHRQDLALFGITWVSGKDSVTGQVVAWAPSEGNP